MKKTICLILGVMVIASCISETSFRNEKLSFEERADDLLERMTLEEKVSMIRYDSPGIKRFGIPEYNHWNECLHGVARAGVATVFPQPIGLGATMDTALMFRIGNAISDEARAKYNDFSSRGKRGMYRGLTFFSPNINIVRDPRWGRGMETFGEDPELTGDLAVSLIKGLQGNDVKYLKTIATAKHFAVHSGPESTRHSADVHPSQRDFIESYTPQFKKAVQEGGVYSVMCAYQRIDGIPCCGNKMLSDLLRKEWGFKGYIVSDCWAITDFFNDDAHNMNLSPAEAGAMAVRAGTDLNCGAVYGKYLVNAVKSGLLTEDDLNTAVKRIIIARMKLGQFDDDEDVPFSKIPYSVVDSKEHQKLALEAARKSMVLLKNEKNILPLSKDLKKIAVIGPNGDDIDVLLGNYHGFPTNPKTPLDGIREKLPEAEVLYAQGCSLTEGLAHLSTIPSEYFYADSSLSTSGLSAEFYENGDFNNEPLNKRRVANIDFRWHDGRNIFSTGHLPRVALPCNVIFDSFGVIFRGYFVPPASGEYAIGCEGYTGFEIIFDGEKILEESTEHDPVKKYKKVNLVGAHPYPLEVRYKQNNSEYPMIRLLWDKEDKNKTEEALKIAKESDIVILCMGLSPSLEGEALSIKLDGFEGGDRVDIALPKVQTQLMKELKKLGKPMVLVLLNGSALAINWENDNIPAILEAWYPGQAGGTAIADILFGDYNPTGKLPITFYKSVKNLPSFDDYNMEGRTHKYFKGKPLYPFGYGLSYE